MFLVIPEGWVWQDGSRAIVDSAIAKVLSQSHRLIAVMLLWEEWADVGETCVAVRKYETILNRRSPYLASDFEQMFAMLGTRKNDSWLSFPGYFSQLIPTLIAYLSQQIIEELDPDRFP